MTERVKEAARLATLGLDPFRYLESRDTLERGFMIQLANAMTEERETLIHNLAVEIANQVSLIFKR